MNYDRMEDCFKTLKDKVSYALDRTNLDRVFDQLDSIEGPTLVCGVGGSSIVASFLAKVLREKKHIIATFVYPRDLRYMDLQGYRNVIAVSYSGSNIGVDAILDLPLNRYLLTGNPRERVSNIIYRMPAEYSYVSISATVIPLMILLLYYRNDASLINEILDSETELVSDSDHYEVMSGYETSTAATLFESSIIESGMGTCVLHDKYNYCHGRINITKPVSSDLLFFRMDNELDDVLYETLQKYYKKILSIERKYEDDVINDAYASIVALKFIRNIARLKGVDISDMKEVPDNDVFYRFSGNM